MSKLPIRAALVLLTGVLIAAINSPAAQAGSKNTAKHFMQGGTFCFAQGDPPPPGGKTKTIKMAVKKAGAGTPYKVAHVDALMHGRQATSPVRSYFDEVTGAATVAPPNDLLPGEQQLQIALNGTSYGTDGDTMNPGVWTVDYALTLGTADLTGRITGVTVFTPVKNGIAGESAKYVTDEPLQPIDCEGFAPQ